MSRTRIPFLAVALLLAVLMPLEQAHCLWMGVGARPAAAHAAAPLHACCAARAAAHGGAHARTLPPCLCDQLPAGSLPAAIAAPAPTVAGVALPPAVAFLAEPAAVRTDVDPALDVGSPPLPDDPGAHGLRAPPNS